MPNVDFIISFEQGTATEAEITENFQAMINDGSVWTLQGMYGRYAASLIEAGVCSEPDRDKAKVDAVYRGL